MITKEELAKLNAKLLDSIRAERIAEIKALLNKGADPFGLVIVSAPGEDKEYIQAFINAYIYRSLDVLDAILEVALNKYHKTGINIIDLSRHVLDDSIDSNFLQAICVSRPEPAYLKRIIEYAIETKQNVKKLLNAPYPMLRPRILSDGPPIKVEVSLAECLVKDLSIESINANLYFTETNVKMDTLTREAWSKWYNCNSEKKSFINAGLIFKGPVDTIQCLVEHGLDIKPLEDMLPKLVKYSTDITQSDNFLHTMFMSGKIELDAGIEITLDKKNRLTIPVYVTNKFNMHRTRLRLHIDFSELNAFVQNTLKAQRENAAHSGYSELNAKIEKLEQSLNNLAESKEKRIQQELHKHSSEALDLFNSLNHAIHNRLLANELLSTGTMVAAQHTQATARMATNAISLLTIATNDVPFAGTVLGIVNAFSTKVAEAQSAKDRKKATAAVSGFDIKHVSIDTAAYITAHAAERCLNAISKIKDMLINTVKNSIQKLQVNREFLNQQHLVAFLCTDAFNVLNNAVTSNIRNNTGPYAAMASTAANKPNSPFADLSAAYHNQLAASSGMNVGLPYDGYNSSPNTGNTPPTVMFSSSSKAKNSPPSQNNSNSTMHSSSDDSVKFNKKKKYSSKCSIM